MWFVRAAFLAVLAGLCGCEDCSPEPDPDAPGTGKRTLSIGWKVMDLNNVELLCEQVDAQFVTVSFYRMVTGEAFNEVFDCFRKTGSRELLEGEYQIGFDLADRYGSIVTLSPRRVQVRGDTSFDDVQFRIDPVGSLVFTLEATGPASNCAAGAQISSFTILLNQANGNCQSTTLTVESAPPYMINCAAPNSMGCIEKTQHVTATNLPAGEYRIRVIGAQTAMPCWQHDQLHRIRAARLVRMEALPLMKTCN
jgi:hypothetical protein